MRGMRRGEGQLHPARWALDLPSASAAAGSARQSRRRARVVRRSAAGPSRGGPDAGAGRSDRLGKAGFLMMLDTQEMRREGSRYLARAAAHVDCGRSDRAENDAYSLVAMLANAGLVSADRLTHLAEIAPRKVARS